jgi:glycolate oxidase FAD binding subunit
MTSVIPTSETELAEAIAAAASNRRSIRLLGSNSKFLMGGPIADAQVQVSTAKLSSIIDYQPKDLTITVAAGFPLRALQDVLKQNGQRLAIDPPEWKGATVGGVVATNSSGPLRRGFGTARDLVIGMTFARLNGQLVRTGGRVVKNVAGLDMAKLLVGSFGTLAAITSISFRVHPNHDATETFLYSAPTIDLAVKMRDTVQKTWLKPVSFDLLSPVVATRVGLRGYVLALRAEGSKSILDRYRRDLPAFEHIAGESEGALWQGIRNFTPDFLRRQPCGVVVRVSHLHSDLAKLLRLVAEPVIARVGSGVSHVYVSSWSAALKLLKISEEQKWQTAIEYVSEDVRLRELDWAAASRSEHVPGSDLLQGIKRIFDPDFLLNRHRLYGRI